MRGGELKRLREALGLSQSQFARRMGVDQKTVWNWERDRVPTLKEFAVRNLLSRGAPPMKSETDGPQPVLTKPLPLYGAIPAGPPDQVPVSADVYPVLAHLATPNRYVLRVQGDSMYPTIHDQDLILVERRIVTEPRAVIGRICVIRVDSGYTIKQLVMMGPRRRERLTLYAHNPRFPHSVLRPGEEASIEGIVIEIVSRRL